MSSKHTYELLADGTSRFTIVGEYASERAGERESVKAALVLMEDNASVQRVSVYHSHPSPGPSRRYVGVVQRDASTITRPT